MENTDQLSTARRIRADEVEERVRAVLTWMLAHGERISFYTVATRAFVARSTLYRNQKLRTLVKEARDDSMRPSLSSAHDEELRMKIACLESKLLYFKRENEYLKILNKQLKRSINYDYYHVEFAS